MSGFRNITIAELETVLQQGGARLLDVRTDAEAARGRISQGDFLPLHLIPVRLRELDNKTRPAVFDCQMGGRSAQAGLPVRV